MTKSSDGPLAAGSLDQAAAIDRRAVLRGAAGLAAIGTGGSLAVPNPSAAENRPSSAPAGGTAPASQTAKPGQADPYAAPVNTGPSSRTTPAIPKAAAAPGTPYLVPTAERWSVTSLLTAGNEAPGARGGTYRMVGVPDGLGAFDNGDGTLTILINHEIDAGSGSVRGHGGEGAFVSRWVLDMTTLEIKSGRSFVETPEKLFLWDAGTWATAAAVKAKLPPPAPPAPPTPPASTVVAPVAAPPAPVQPPPAVGAPAAPSPPSLPLKASAHGPAVKEAAAIAVVPPPPTTPLDIDRLCSADLAPISAFYNAASKLGYDGHIFLNGEEGEHKANRAFAWVVADDTAWELPAFAFGRAGDEADPPPAWENLLAHPGTGDATVVMANSDGGLNQVHVYLGTKRAQGSAIEKAGLTGGRLFSLKVPGVREEHRFKNIGLKKGRLGRAQSKRVGLAAPNQGTSFSRPEDGAWDPVRPNVYYFATTDRENFATANAVGPKEKARQVGRTRLWAVTFDDVRKISTDGRPVAKIELLLDGTEGGNMFDNVTVDRAGIVYLCEDMGEAKHNGKIWAYDTKTGAFSTITKFDPAKFGDVVRKVYTPPVLPFVDDKETSGIVDVTELFSKAGWFRPGSTVLLVVVQAHFGYDPADALGAEISEGGQLLLLVKAP